MCGDDEGGAVVLPFGKIINGLPYMPAVHWKNDDNLNGRVALASCGVVAKKNLNFTDADAGVVALIVVTCRSCLRSSSRLQC